MDRSSHHNGLDDESRDLAGEDGSTEGPDSTGASGRSRFDLKGWIKENPKAARLGGGGAVLLVLIVVLLWVFVFGGSDQKKTRRPRPGGTPAQRQALAPDIGDEEDEDDMSDDPEDAEPDEEESESPTEEEPEPEAPPLPEDVATWEQEHFDRAHRERDPKLLEAVGHLGRSSVHNEAAVKVLAALLQAPQAAEEPEEDKQPVSPGSPRRPIRPGVGRTGDGGKLAEAVVEALAINDTPAAREVLEQIISGTLPTEGDESRVVEAGLKALAEQPTSGNEDLLFRLLTASDQFRKPSGTAAPVVPGRPGKVSGQPLSAEWLRGRVLGLVEKTASVGFRAKLAGFLGQPTTPLTWRAEMGRFLLEPSVDNLGAQFVMYQSGRLEDDVRVSIEQHFAARSAQAMQSVLGVPQDMAGHGSGGARRTTAARGAPVAAGRIAPAATVKDPELAFRLARQLWGERSTEAFTQRLAEIDRRDDPGHLLALCATMPVESARTALLESLRARHGHGPDALERGGIPRTVVSDPGFLLVVKSLDRQEVQAPAAGRPAARAPQAGGRAGDDAGQKWMKFSETLVLSWCERLDAAARIQAENARLAGKNPAELRRLEDLPIELHEGAEVRSAYHLVLPSGMAGKLSGAQVGPMRIQYVRMEDRTAVKRMLGYYRRVLSMRGDGRPVENGAWFDSYRSTEAPGVRCSVDVLIRLADKKTAREIDLDADENLVIEVLSIEAREP